MNAGEGDVSDQEEFDLGDDLDVQQDEYFPFDDEPAFALNASLYGPAGAASTSFSSAPLPPSSNLPLSSHHISSLNQSIMDQATANVQTHLTAYELHVMQSQVLAHAAAALNQGPHTLPADLSFSPAATSQVGALSASHIPEGFAHSAMPGNMAGLQHGGWVAHPPSSLPGGTQPPGGSGFIVTQSGMTPNQSLMYTSMPRTGSWDPLASKDWDATKPSDLCLGRIARDLHSLYTDPIPGIMVHANENDVTRMLALIKGPEDTPYDGGFFQFLLRCPPDYPITNPRVKLLTTGGGSVRFNPNLYANGKVCLSLLGTWAGPQWSPALNISSLLLSIQSLMCEFPYKNEPGFDRVSNTNPEVVRYNHVIRHETIRVAVIDMVREALATQPDSASKFGAGDQREKPGLPSSFRTMILRGFVENYEKYLRVCEKEKGAAPIGGAMPTICGDRRGIFKWDDLARALVELKTRVEFEMDRLNNAAAKNGLDDGDGDSDKMD